MMTRSQMTPGILSAILLSFSFGAVSVRADQPLDLKAELAKPILDPATPLAEVQDYVEERIPKLPDVKTLGDWERLAEKWRKDLLDNVVFRGEAAKWRDHPLKVEYVGEPLPGPGYSVKKLRYEILPGMWIPALLYEPESLAKSPLTLGPSLQGGEGKRKVPVVLNVNGHDPNGKAAEYKQTRCINQVKRGMIALNVEWFGMGQLRHEGYAHTRMNQLDLCGSSGIAPFYLAMSKGIDLLLKHPQADPQRVAVAGLSGGGWQTIFISGLDPRVTLANPVAGYSSYSTRVRNHSDLGDSEQTPCDLGKYADYVHLTAIRAPRATLLTFNAHDDCCFAAGHALPPLLAACRPVYALYGETDRLLSHVNHVPGDHNFGQDNREALYRAFGTFFYEGKNFDPKEVANEPGEVKKADQLLVDIPDENATFTSLAKSLAEKLPRADEAPKGKAAVSQWQDRRRKLLAELVAAKEYLLMADEVQTTAADSEKEATGTQIRRWRVRLSDSWTVPVVELSRGEPTSTTILVADTGRAAVADEVEKLLAAGERVLAVDPFYFGESKINSRDWLFALLIATIGDRPLGLQASQLATMARWAHDTDRNGSTVTLEAIGPRSSLFTLVAAVLEPQVIGKVRLQGAIGLKQQVIEQNRGVNEAPELFCFGLLEHFDLPQLQALIAPRQVEMK